MPLFIKKEIRQSFNHAAKTYDEAAFFQREVADRLMDRLHSIHLQPHTILDLGAGTGYSARNLEMYYKKATIIAFDLAENMLLQSAAQKRWFDRKRYVCGDAEKLPFQNHSFDLIFSNLVLHWVVDIDSTIKELRRILKPGGIIIIFNIGTRYLVGAARKLVKSG